MLLPYLSHLQNKMKGLLDDNAKLEAALRRFQTEAEAKVRVSAV